MFDEIYLKALGGEDPHNPSLETCRKLRHHRRLCGLLHQNDTEEFLRDLIVSNKCGWIVPNRKHWERYPMVIELPIQRIVSMTKDEIKSNVYRILHFCGILNRLYLYYCLDIPHGLHNYDYATIDRQKKFSRALYDLPEPFDTMKLFFPIGKFTKICSMYYYLHDKSKVERDPIEDRFYLPDACICLSERDEHIPSHTTSLGKNVYLHGNRVFKMCEEWKREYVIGIMMNDFPFTVNTLSYFQGGVITEYTDYEPLIRYHPYMHEMIVLCLMTLDLMYRRYDFCHNDLNMTNIRWKRVRERIVTISGISVQVRVDIKIIDFGLSTIQWGEYRIGPEHMSKHRIFGNASYPYRDIRNLCMILKDDFVTHRIFGMTTLELCKNEPRCIEGHKYSHMIEAMRREYPGLFVDT